MQTLREHPDRRSYVQQISSLYESARSDALDAGTPAQFVHQEAVGKCLSEDSTLRGLVVMHGIGTGKTLTSIRVAENNPGRPVWVLTKAALSGRDALRRANSVVGRSDATDAEVRRAYSDLRYAPYTKDVLKESGGIFIGDRRLALLDERERIRTLSATYKFAHYNGGPSFLRSVLGVPPGSKQMTSDVVQDVLLGHRRNPFDGHVVVVDEAHNVSEGVINTVLSADDPNSGSWSRTPGNSSVLYLLLTRASNCKVVLLTATPIVNRNVSIGILCNMAAGATRYMSIKNVESRGGGGRTLAEVLAAAMGDAPSPVSLRDDYARGVRVLASTAPAGFLFRSTLHPHELVREPDASPKDSWRTGLAAVCRGAGFRMEDAYRYGDLPFPSPLEVGQDGRLVYRPEALSLFEQQYDPRGATDLDGAARFFRAAAGLLSTYEGMTDAMPELRYHRFVAGKARVPRMRASAEPDVLRVMMPRLQKGAYLEADPVDARPMRRLGRDETPAKTYQNTMPATQVALAHPSLSGPAGGPSLRAPWPPPTSRRIKSPLLARSVKYGELLYNLLGRGAAPEYGAKAIVYSRLKEKGGVYTIRRLLVANGFTEWSPDQAPEPTAPADRCFAVYSGDVRFSEQRDSILRWFDAYNRGTGDVSRGFCVLLMTNAGAEGLQTRGVEQVHVMEPFWHNIRLEQVVGRARRADSHPRDVWPDAHVDVYVYVAAIRGNGERKTIDERMWDVAQGKLVSTSELMERGVTPVSLETLVDGDTKAIDAGEALRRREDYVEGRHFFDLLRVGARPIRTSRDYRRVMRQSLCLQNFAAVRAANGGRLRSYDRLRRATALEAVVDQSPLLPPEAAFPWMIPVIRSRVRVAFTDTKEPHIATQYGLSADRDAVPTELAALSDTRWPQVIDGESHHVSREERLRRLYEVAPALTDPMGVSGDGPWRVLFPAPAADKGGEPLVRVKESRKVLVTADGTRLMRSTHRFKSSSGLERSGHVPERCDLWTARGDRWPGPRYHPSTPISRSTDAYFRCGTMLSNEPCRGGNRYEPARDCLHHGPIEELLDDVLQATQTTVTYPPSRANLDPELYGEEVQLVGLREAPLHRCTRLRPVPMALGDRSVVWDGFVGGGFSAEGPEGPEGPAPSGAMGSVCAEVLRKRAPWKSLLASGRECARLVAPELRPHAEALAMAEEHLRSYRPDLGDLHPRNPLRALCTSYDASRAALALALARRMRWLRGPNGERAAGGASPVISGDDHRMLGYGRLPSESFPAPAHRGTAQPPTNSEGPVVVVPIIVADANGPDDPHARKRRVWLARVGTAVMASRNSTGLAPTVLRQRLEWASAGLLLHYSYGEDVGRYTGDMRGQDAYMLLRMALWSASQKVVRSVAQTAVCSLDSSLIRRMAAHLGNRSATAELDLIVGGIRMSHPYDGQRGGDWVAMREKLLVHAADSSSSSTEAVTPIPACGGIRVPATPVYGRTITGWRVGPVLTCQAADGQGVSEEEGEEAGELLAWPVLVTAVDPVDPPPAPPGVVRTTQESLLSNVKNLWIEYGQATGRWAGAAGNRPNDDDDDDDDGGYDESGEEGPDEDEALQVDDEGYGE